MDQAVEYFSLSTSSKMPRPYYSTCCYLDVDIELSICRELRGKAYVCFEDTSQNPGGKMVLYHPCQEFNDIMNQIKKQHHLQFGPARCDCGLETQEKFNVAFLPHAIEITQETNAENRISLNYDCIDKLLWLETWVYMTYHSYNEKYIIHTRTDLIEN